MTGHRFIPTQEVYRPSTRPDLMDAEILARAIEKVGDGFKGAGAGLLAGLVAS